MTSETAARTGSSPLARGLRGPLSFVDRLARIIPARAGFTRPGTAAYSPSADHPRSRGVYQSRRPIPASTTGSSPLARGLPPVAGAAAAAGGIIPARAGFTDSQMEQDLNDEDHPRSRGVYRGRMSPISIPRGSSPLARGLRDDALTHPRVIRIIPARAGFTRGASRGGWWPADHPRSRGVYPEHVPLR